MPSNWTERRVVVTGLGVVSPVGTGAVMFQCEMLDDGAINAPYILVDRLYLRTSGNGF